METRREKYRYAEIALVIGVIVTCITFLSWFFVASAEKATETKKQIELRSLGDSISIYQLREGHLPRNAGALKSWCTIGQAYHKGTCLGELVALGYINDLPSSPDRDPYLYQYTENGAFVATKISLDPQSYPRENLCYGNQGEALWCYRAR